MSSSGKKRSTLPGRRRVLLADDDLGVGVEGVPADAGGQQRRDRMPAESEQGRRERQRRDHDERGGVAAQQLVEGGVRGAVPDQVQRQRAEQRGRSDRQRRGGQRPSEQSRMPVNGRQRAGRPLR
ncbi:hypothetical protein DLE60_16385 [Micromonospora globispora]|uniref:Uncharacterized protein n=1 Tax=Micromonospora globispora TaxID=1450148 RepID=A0A317JSW8_9ACTN|nr:hypothetical protein [Micromonospora globispora]PWU43478.1 hypothetical protein DLJ46_31490 [Micromonospora globispora]PWU59482.1 hypothetical protein DLE60_16385 [Micromonospora globispora]